MMFDKAASDRLREERKRLGWTQQEAATHCNTDQTLWSRFERYEGAPPGGHVLAGLAAAGGDVHYVLTGIKGNAVPTPDEQALVADFRAMDARDKQKQLWISAVMRMNTTPSSPASAPPDVGRAMRLLEVFLTSGEDDKVLIEISAEVAMTNQNRSSD